MSRFVDPSSLTSNGTRSNGIVSSGAPSGALSPQHRQKHRPFATTALAQAMSNTHRLRQAKLPGLFSQQQRRSRLSDSSRRSSHASLSAPPMQGKRKAQSCSFEPGREHEADIVFLDEGEAGDTNQADSSATITIIDSQEAPKRAKLMMPTSARSEGGESDAGKEGDDAEKEGISGSKRVESVARTPSAEKNGCTEKKEYESADSAEDDDDDDEDSPPTYPDPHNTPEMLPAARPSKRHHCSYLSLRPGELPVTKWKKNTVRLPHYDGVNLHNIFFAGSFRQTVPKWEVVTAELSKPRPITPKVFCDIVRAINAPYAADWDFGAIALLAEDKELGELFARVVTKAGSLALRLPSLFPRPIPLLGKRANYTLSLSQEQVACLLANALFSTFPGGKGRSEGASAPSINFVRLYSVDGWRFRPDVNNAKWQCLLHYFDRVTTAMPDGVVTYHRQYINSDFIPKWKSSTAPLTSFTSFTDGTIEDHGLGMLQADFANMVIGGGVLGNGAVQEEIRFLISPEMIVSRLFCLTLAERDTVTIIGAERFSKYTGYGQTFRFDGDFVDTTKRDAFRRRKTMMVALDATEYRRKRYKQYHGSHLSREINKAYAAVYSHFSKAKKHEPFATGNWGCGAFGGDVELKMLIQWMAASQACRDVVYFTFGNRDQKVAQDELVEGITSAGWVVADLHRVMREYSHYRKICAKRKLNNVAPVFEFVHCRLESTYPVHDEEESEESEESGEEEGEGTENNGEDGDGGKDGAATDDVDTGGAEESPSSTSATNAVAFTAKTTTTTTATATTTTTTPSSSSSSSSSSTTASTTTTTTIVSAEAAMASTRATSSSSGDSDSMPLTPPLGEMEEESEDDGEDDDVAAPERVDEGDDGNRHGSELQERKMDTIDDIEDVDDSDDEDADEFQNGATQLLLSSPLPSPSRVASSSSPRAGCARARRDSTSPQKRQQDDKQKQCLLRFLRHSSGRPGESS